jgi:hypothetical protein
MGRPAAALLALTAVVAAGEASPPAERRLSDERTVTRWAYPEHRGWARTGPSPRAPRIARLRRLTEDGRPELYVALRSRIGSDGALWIQVRLPRRPNGTTGWVHRADLGPWRRVDTQLEIDRRRLRATLRRQGRVIWSARIGIGASATPTPAGRFYVREKLRGLAGDPTYGPWAIGTSAYSRASDWPGGGVIGIHGTDRQRLIPGRPSHGCIRLRNADVTKLVRFLPLGSPVWVH